MTILIRDYRADDLDAIKSITVEAFNGVSIDRNIEAEFGEINGHDWRWRKARHIDEDVEREGSRILVAESEGRVVGYVTTWLDRDAGMGFIPNLAVDGNQRGLGIGRRLLEEALRHFREQDLPVARIETLAQNEIGQQLYPSLGFREVARQVHYCIELGQERA